MQDEERPRPRELSEDPVESGPATAPARAEIAGSYTRLLPVGAAQAAELYALSHGEAAGPELWAYLPYGPFPDEAAFTAWLAERAASEDPLFFAVLDGESGRPEGMASYLNIAPANASIEIGHIWFSPVMQRSPKSTDALHAMIRHAIENLGYRLVLSAGRGMAAPCGKFRRLAGAGELRRRGAPKDVAVGDERGLAAQETECPSRP